MLLVEQSIIPQSPPRVGFSVGAMVEPDNCVILIVPQRAFGFARVVVLVVGGSLGVGRRLGGVLGMSFLPDLELVGYQIDQKLVPRFSPTLTVASSSEHQKVMEGKTKVKLLTETPPFCLQET